MATFSYNAINAQGIELDGLVAASDSASALEQLRSRGLLAERITEISGGAEREGAGRFKTVKPKSLQIFSRQFATMIDAGMNVVSALVILEQQTSDSALAVVISQLREDVESGLLLSEAMAAHPKVFSRLFVAMVEAGEAAGILDIVLDRAAMQIEKEQQIKRKVKGALVYPCVVLVFATLVLIAMLLFIVPVFIKIFQQLHGQLPILTQYVLYASNALRGYWFIIFPLAAALIVGLRRARKTEKGNAMWDRFRLKVPMKIGDTIQKIAIARFARTLSTLVSSGVDIIKALEITGQASGNVVIEEALVDVRKSVREGSTIADPLIADSDLPADGQPDGPDRRGDRRAREDAG